MPGIFWFTGIDLPIEYGYEPFRENGLVRNGFTRKPSFKAYQTVVQELGEKDFLRSAGSFELGGDQVEAYLFAGASRLTWVMWTNSQAPTEISLPQPQVFRILDMYGQQQALTPTGDGGVSIMLTENPVFVELTQRFVDVPLDFFVYDSIEWLAARNIVSGYSDGTFRPFNNTTRGQLAKIVTLSEGWEIDSSSGPHFNDVPRENPFYDYIETAYQNGVISGYEDGSFRWYNNITRVQLSKIIVLARDWKLNTVGGPHFLDVLPDNPFYAHIETAFSHSIISGYDAPDGREFRWYRLCKVTSVIWSG